MACQNITTGGINNFNMVISANPNHFAIRVVNSGSIGSVTTFNNRENYNKGSLNYGAGVSIDSTGRYLYNAETAGSGVLENLLLVNRGPNTLYFGIDTETFSVANGTALASGESFHMEDDVVRRVWVITSASVTTASAHGTYRYNDNTI